MENEKFNALAEDMLPLIEAMKAFLKKHDVGCVVSVTLDASGYFSFLTHDSKMKMYRIKDEMDVEFEHLEEE